MLMADYENYSQTAKSYDSTRTSTGCEIWYGELLGHFGDLNQLEILDAGCGTGNYTLALAQYVRQVTALDVNEAMLGIARQKVAYSELKEKITLKHGLINELPFENNSFDAVMFNQVLHHLDPRGTIEFEQLRVALKEAERVLRPNGLIMINTSSRLQMRHGFWYLELVPEARQQGVDHMVDTNDLKRFLNESGFDLVSRTVPLDCVLQGESFYDCCGPVSAEWRSGDSIWSLASADELSSALAKVKDMDASGVLMDYMQTQDQGRRDYGQITFWVAEKRKKANADATQ